MPEIDLSPAGRAELRRLADAATPGPWPVHHEDLRGGRYFVVRLPGDDMESIDLHHSENGEANAAFIAASRTAVPALLDALDRAEARIAELEREWRCETENYARASDRLVSLQRENAAATARNARLREALTMFRDYGCPVCHGDCGSANPPVSACPMQAARAALAQETPDA